MKLQKQLSRKVGQTEYPKYVVTIPPSQVMELGWKEGEKLEAKVNGTKLILTPTKKERKKQA